MNNFCNNSSAKYIFDTYVHDISKNIYLNMIVEVPAVGFNTGAQA